MNTGIAVVFFDVGRTLGELDAAGELVVYRSTAGVLSAFRDGLGLRLGVISNLPKEMTTEDLVALLARAGLAEWFPLEAIVTSADAGKDKPSAVIYRYAAKCVDMPLERCLYVGEDAGQVEGAIAAGMAGMVIPVPST